MVFFSYIISLKGSSSKGRQGSGMWHHIMSPCGNGDIQKSLTAQGTLVSLRFLWQGSRRLRGSGSATTGLTVWGELKQFIPHTPRFTLGFRLLSSETDGAGIGHRMISICCFIQSEKFNECLPHPSLSQELRHKLDSQRLYPHVVYSLVGETNKDPESRGIYNSNCWE